MNIFKKLFRREPGPQAVEAGESPVIENAMQTVVVDAFGKTFRFEVPARAQQYPVLDPGTQGCVLMVDGKTVQPVEILRTSAGEFVL